MKTKRNQFQSSEVLSILMKWHFRNFEQIERKRGIYRVPEYLSTNPKCQFI